jgi:hypothetical protein
MIDELRKPISERIRDVAKRQHSSLVEIDLRAIAAELEAMAKEMQSHDCPTSHCHGCEGTDCENRIGAWADQLAPRVKE